MKLTQYDKQTIMAMNTTKGELIKQSLTGCHYDTALPQGWLNDFIEYSGLDYSYVLSTTVYLYSEEITGPFSFDIAVNVWITAYRYK